MTKKRPCPRNSNKHLHPFIMTAPTLFRVLACTALLSAPLHAQLYTLHGDGVKKTERVVEKADYSDYELVWHDEFDKDGRPDPAKWNYEHGFVRNRRNSGTSRKTPGARTATSSTLTPFR